MCKVSFFCSGPVPAPNGPTGLLLPLPFAGAGAKKQLPGWCFFLLWPRRKVATPKGVQQKRNFAHPGTTAKKNLETNDTGHKQKGATTKPKKRRLTHWPWTAMLTHFFSGATFPAGDFFFAAAPRGAHSLTVGWGDFGKALVIFFCCGPAEPGEPTTKNVWCTASGLKTRRPQQKKKHHFQTNVTIRGSYSEVCGYWVLVA